MATAVLRTFEVYQKGRVQFVQTVAELAKRKENFEALQSAGRLILIRRPPSSQTTFIGCCPEHIADSVHCHRKNGVQKC
jgi:hypothetical protein